MARCFVFALVVGMCGIAWAGPKKAGQACAAHAECVSGLHCVRLVCKDILSPPDPCINSNDCKHYGKCKTAMGRTCAVSSDADCRASTVCRDYGACAKRDGVDYCVASSDADCRASKACRYLGTCVKGDGLSCVANSDADCRASKACLGYGYCGLDGFKCGENKSDEHCRKLPECKQIGNCALWTQWARFNSYRDGVNPPYLMSDFEADEGRPFGMVPIPGGPFDIRTPWKGECVPAEDKHCRESDICKTHGRCGLLNGKCAPTEDKHCLESTISCVKEGYCFAKRGKCTCKESQDCVAPGKPNLGGSHKKRAPEPRR